MAKKVVHVEFPAQDVDRAERFWEGVGGWSIEDAGMPGIDYRMFQDDLGDSDDYPARTGSQFPAARPGGVEPGQRYLPRRSGAAPVRHAPRLIVLRIVEGDPRIEAEVGRQINPRPVELQDLVLPHRRVDGERLLSLVKE